MARIPWYYIWSEKYEIFHTIFQDITSRVFPILREEFAIRPLFVEQTVLDSKLVKDNKAHPFTGCTLKIDAIIHCIENNNNRHFVFSDIDIVIIKPTIKGLLEPYSEYDMVFMSEDINSNQANIGFCYIKASAKTLLFWKKVKEQTMIKFAHDQQITNDLLLKTDCKTTLFSEKDIISQKTCSSNREFKIVQILSSGNMSAENQYLEKLEALSIFVNLTPYTYFKSVSF